MKTRFPSVSDAETRAPRVFVGPWYLVTIAFILFPLVPNLDLVLRYVKGSSGNFCARSTERSPSPCCRTPRPLLSCNPRTFRGQPAAPCARGIRVTWPDGRRGECRRALCCTGSDGVSYGLAVSERV